MPRWRARGTLLGLGVGDALGAPFEFQSPGECALAVRAGLEMSGGGGWEAGEWTDDTAMALALAESIAARGLLDTDDLAARYIAWANSGPKDIGNITRTALKGARSADDARRRAQDLHERTGLTAGNGTVMRAAPIALAASDVVEAVEAACEDARLTHYDPIAGAASAALCAALLAIARGGDPLAAALDEARGHAKLVDALEVVASGADEAIARLASGSEWGTCWTALAVGLRAFRHPTFEAGVSWAISLGRDTDTNAAVAGALLGCLMGSDAIPDRWLGRLCERGRVEKAADAVAAEA